MFQPIYTISPGLLQSIKQIALLIHELNRQHLPETVLAEFLAEARAVSTYASTSIEGNPLPLTEVKRLLKNQPTNVRQSEKEVLNYNQALIRLNESLDRPFDEELLLQIHQNVTADLLPAHQSGRFRQEPVVVNDPRSGEVVYLPPNYEDVPSLVAQLIAFARENRAILDPILLAGIFHKQFVAIHPFIDGNGRTTRLATKFLLAGLGINTFNLFSFENYYNQNVTGYFQQVGLFGDYYELAANLDFTNWLEYFAEGILDELMRVAKQLEKRQATPDTTLKAHHQKILDHIKANGFITDRDYAQLTDRAKATRSVDFNFLIKLGLIVRKGRGRGTYYELM